jgi:hypothetical protein
VYFDNVGGAMLDTILMHISIGARISLCGMLTNYNAPAEAAINNLFQLILKRASAHGFLVTDYLHRYTEAFEKLTAWEAEGKLKYNLTVVEGIEQAPQALANVFASRYLGKVVVQVSEEP